MKKFLFALILTMLITIPSHAGTFNPPPIPESEVRYYKAYYANQSDQPDMKIVGFKLMHEESALTFKEWVKWNSQGGVKTMTIYRDAISRNNTRSMNEFLFNVGNELKLISFDRKWFAPDGSPIREWNFGYAEPSLGYPEKTYHHMLIHWLARSMNLAPGSQASFNVWLDTTYVYPMILVVEGEERIKTPAGEFNCVRVKAKLDKNKLDDTIGKILSHSMPEYTYWLEKDGTHGLVRMRWPMIAGIYGEAERYQTQDLIRVTR